MFPQAVEAHGAGLPPFFKINGELPNESLLQTVEIYPTNFTVPQDISSDNFLVNQPITFEIDTTLLKQAVTEEIINQTKFSWDFGDGTKAQGLKNTHQYKKKGSYILTINTEFDSSIPVQLIESVQLNIIPDKNYQLPKAVIKVNGKKIDDPTKVSLDINLNNNLVLDASESIAPTSKIIEYLWDFGDGKTGKQVTTGHKYLLLNYVSPALQIKDENGFISQSYVDIRNDAIFDSNNREAEDPQRHLLIIGTAVLGVSLLGVAGALVLKKLPRKKK